jgi:hypothetical protein
MNKVITLGFGILGTTAFVGVALGYTHQLIIGAMCIVIVIMSLRNESKRI